MKALANEFELPRHISRNTSRLTSCQTMQSSWFRQESGQRTARRRKENGSDGSLVKGRKQGSEKRNATGKAKVPRIRIRTPTRNASATTREDTSARIVAIFDDRRECARERERRKGPRPERQEEGHTQQAEGEEASVCHGIPGDALGVCSNKTNHTSVHCKRW